MESIRIRGARTHNLKNIELDLPRNQFIVITGLSGSGKSSLAFDTLFAEGQRRYVESLSAYARQFLSMMEKPDVDLIEGLSPAISIEQKSTSHNPRSTVGTVTEIYDYLRLLYARTGDPRCPDHGVSLQAQTVSEMVDQLMRLPPQSRLMICAPIIQQQKGEHRKIFTNLQREGFARALVNGEMHELDEPPTLEKNKKSDIEIIVDRLRIREGIEQRLVESLETALTQTDGLAHAYLTDRPEADPLLFSSRHACPHCGFSIETMEPRMFSFNNPSGACSSCDGLGQLQFFDPDKVVRDPELSIAGGAIPSWDRSHAYYFFLISCVAKHYGFDLEQPFNRMSEEHRDIILHGSGSERIEFSWRNRSGRRSSRIRCFVGVLKHLEKRYHETDSGHRRDELSRYISARECPECEGTRLRREARHVFVDDAPIHSLVATPIADALETISTMKLSGWRGEIAERILLELKRRLHFLHEVGLGYLTLDRGADSLSGGEAQRIRLASQIGAGLVGVMYILDEPSIGLHQRDNARLLNSLTRLRDLGNTVVVVEHDEETIRAADHVVDIGPGAGIHGGTVCAQGQPQMIMDNPDSLTGKYLSGELAIPVPGKRRRYDPERALSITGASGNNLQALSLSIPIGLFTCITGVSGSGKSTLINQTLYPLAARLLNKATTLDTPAAYDRAEGLTEHLDKVISIDQSPIGRTPRSNPATYTGLFTPIRDLFAATGEARTRGYKPGRFSFNVSGGRCSTCKGDGVIKVEMHFLSDIYVPCDQCHGMRYNRETLEVAYKGKNISEVLEMTVEEAAEFFAAIPQIARKLETLQAVGLSYIHLGQPATTLSGGEAQRIKLARELSRRDTGDTLYLLDEPTTGLHFQDVRQLLSVLEELCSRGNTIVVIEHNLDVIKTADWVVDLGPEGGAEGGTVVAAGTPEQIARIKASYTGQFLKPLLAKKKKQPPLRTG